MLAWLTPLGSGLEQAGARAQAAELQAQLTLAERRAERLRQLEGSVARKDIEAAAIEADSLRRRLAAIDGALAGREALRAPVDGIVSDTRGVNGAIVDARATLFEIIDPRHLQVEALAHAALPGGTVEASGLAGRGSDAQPLRLGFIGAGRSLREQALPLRFRIEPAAGDAPPLLAVGQPVSVFVRVDAPRTGVALPAEAVVRGPDNQPQVWVHSAAERFEARRVDTQPLSAGEVLVTHGLSGGERVVTTGAALLAQIR
ncbi:MAG: HlyD family efflux transporter periplasmic adaptor subunit [Proteobacteria bacterium]|nr:HlyD family efflux transporter periplasmic adaptor subunit [Pseudomonadota bacterium]